MFCAHLVPWHKLQLLEALLCHWKLFHFFFFVYLTQEIRLGPFLASSPHQWPVSLSTRFTTIGSGFSVLKISKLSMALSISKKRRHSLLKTSHTHTHTHNHMTVIPISGHGYHYNVLFLSPPHFAPHDRPHPKSFPLFAWLKFWLMHCTIVISFLFTAKSGKTERCLGV